MKLNQEFRTRRDLEEWLILFQEEGVLEMPLVSAFITELFRGDKTRAQLIDWVKEAFPNLNAEAEVDEMIHVYQDLELLENV